MTLTRAIASFRHDDSRRLTLGIVVFCLAMIALIWATITERIISERADVLEGALRQNSNLAVAFEQYSLRILRNAEPVTQFVASAYLRRGPTTNLAAILAERASQNDFLEVIAIFDANGQLVATSQPQMRAGVYIGDREEFKVHASVTDTKLHVGKTGVTPLWNEAAVPITRRIGLADGSFGGVVVVLVRPRRFTNFYEDAAIQPGEVFILAGLDGMTRARKVGDRETFGDDLNGSKLFAQRARQSTGVYHGSAHLDGMMRLQAYRTLRDYPLVAIVASSEAEVLAEYSRRRSLYYGGAVVASVCIVLFALVVIVAVHRVARTAGALAKSEARFRDLTELSADWWWEQDAGLRFVQVAGGSTSLGGFSISDFIGRYRWELPNVKPLNTTWEAHQAVLEAHLPFGDLLMEHTDASGTTHFIIVAGKPTFDGRGKFSGYRGVGTDVTEKFEIESALRESEARFRHLAELSSDWYWEQDDQFRFTFLSQGHQRTVDVDHAMRIGKTRWELGLEGLTDEQWVEHRHLLDMRKPFRNLEYRWTSASNGIFHISISGDPVFDTKGRFTGYRGTGTDITQRKLVEAEILALNAALEEHVQQRTEQLEAANHELRAFGYSIAHDMRAPLRAIGGFSQMLLDNHLPAIDSAGKTLFTRILTNVEWMGQLIDGLLALSQLSMAPVAREAIDLTNLSQEIVDEMRRLEPGRHVELVLAKGLVIEGDRIMVRRMMQNLIGNAWKYTANQALAKIEIGVMQDANGTPTYFIKDNGAGFDMNYVGKLFQAFQRLHSPSEFQGTGIGLAIVSRIVRKHGGQIRAEAVVGKGADFYFTFWSETPT